MSWIGIPERFRDCFKTCDMIEGPCACGGGHELSDWPEEVQLEVLNMIVEGKRDTEGIKLIDGGVQVAEGLSIRLSDKTLCKECGTKHRPQDKEALLTNNYYSCYFYASHGRWSSPENVGAHLKLPIVPQETL